MNIVVACKVVPDDKDIQVRPDRTLDFGRAGSVVSLYDLNAIEAAARLAASVEGSSLTAVSVGGPEVGNSKLAKSVLSRGPARFVYAADEGLAGLDARESAEALAGLVEGLGSWDVVVCGDGSADEYARQVDVQLAERLGAAQAGPVLSMALRGGALVVERALEDRVETLELDLPCVVSAAPEAAEPRIPGMRDILAAGKKPAERAEGPGGLCPSIETLNCLAPERPERLGHVEDASAEGAVGRFAAALRAAL